MSTPDEPTAENLNEMWVLATAVCTTRAPLALRQAERSLSRRPRLTKRESIFGLPDVIGGE